MPNKENLKNLADRPAEEARAIRAKGAKKANEVKRRNKQFREFGKMVLNLRPKEQKKLLKEWELLGYEIERNGLPTVAERMAMNLAKRALDGDDNAFRLIMSYTHNPTMQEQIDMDRVKALAERNTKVDVNVNSTAEGADVINEIRARMSQIPQETAGDPA